MPSKKQQACVTRYVSVHYDKITITAPKGAREHYKQIAAAEGMSLNALVNKLLKERAEKHGIKQSGGENQDFPAVDPGASESR